MLTNLFAGFDIPVLQLVCDKVRAMRWGFFFALLRNFSYAPKYECKYYRKLYL